MMNLNKILKAAISGPLLAIVLLAALAPHARAQVGSASLTGTVQDASGALVPGATVKLLNLNNRTTLTQQSDGKGLFSFQSLSAGDYQVDIAAKGFQPFSRKGISIHIGDVASLDDLKLRIASDSTTVTVTTQADEVTPTTTGEQSYTLTSKQIENLNIEGRSAIELLGLVPGAANSGNFNSNSYQAPVEGFTQNASAFSVNGNRFDLVAIVSDGAPVTDINTSGASAVTPNVDMISESKVSTAAFTSEQPNGPIVVQTETKSGGHDFHGEGYITVRNHALDDTDWRVKHNGLAKPDDGYDYPGFNIGGPIHIPGTDYNKWRDKLFFFGSFEYSIQHVQDPLIDIRESVVPTAAERTGDFTDSAYLASVQGPAYFAGATPCNGYVYGYCSAVGTIDPNQIDKGGQILLNAFPLPNADPITHNGFNYVSAFTLSQPRNQELMKIDYNINNKNHLSARYNHESETVPFPYGAYNNFTNTPYPADPINHDYSNSITSNLSTTITPTLVNELTATNTRLSIGTYFKDLSAVSRTATGYPYGELFGQTNDVLPNVSFGGCGGCSSLYIGGGQIPPYSSLQQTFVISDSATKILGNHIVKGGIYFARLSYNISTVGNENGAVSTEYYLSNTTGNAFADLLVGNIGYYAQSSSNFQAQMLNSRFDFFLQDAWKASPRFTVNYGVRVDHIPWWQDRQGRIVVFDPSQYDPTAAVGSTSGLVSHATHPSTSIYGATSPGFEIAPSGGFAYDLRGNGKSILRGGAGVNYYADPGTNAFAAVEAPPNENFFSTYSQLTLASASSVPTGGYYPAIYTVADQHNHKLPVTYSYNLAIAQQLPGSIRFEVSYTGNASKNLVGFGNQNVVPEGCELPGGPGQAPGYAPGTYNDQLCRPYSNLQGIGTANHNLNSYFNSLQATASRQRGPYSFWLTYTYGKALAYTCENPFDMRRCYAPPAFDRSQDLNISYYINLPNVSQKHLGNHTVLNGILDHWSISGIEQFASGNPIKVTPDEYDGIDNRTIGFYGVSDAANNYSSPSFDSRVLVGTPDETAAPVLVCDPRSHLHKGEFFNASCFQSPTLGTSPTNPSLGTYRLPYIHGPLFENDTIGLYKGFLKKDQRLLEFRAEAFNFFNHPQYTFIQYDQNLYLTYDAYGAAPTNATVGGAGYAENKLGARVIQFTAKYHF